MKHASGEALGIAWTPWKLLVVGGVGLTALALGILGFCEEDLRQNPGGDWLSVGLDALYNTLGLFIFHGYHLPEHVFIEQETTTNW